MYLLNHTRSGIKSLDYNYIEWHCLRQKGGGHMPQQPADMRTIFGMHLIGREINLRDVSDDGGEVFGRIVAITLKGNDLYIKTADTRGRWWFETEFRPSHENEFEGIVERVEIEPDGTIVLIPWDAYDYVYIRPTP